MTSVPDYIAERIRHAVPSGCAVISGSTPVVSFGNAEAAWVATLGLNPSLREFADTKGKWLTGKRRRLATADSLGIANLTVASDEQVQQVVTDCYSYFQRNPYEWFADLENLMQTAVGSSFYDGSAAHLDLVQWATNPTWAGLSPATRAQVISEDREFLRQQLQSEHIRLVLLNGRTVINQVIAMGIPLQERGRVTVGSKSPSIVVGMGYGAAFVGWSENLQSGHGVSTALKLAIARRVRTEIAALGVAPPGASGPAATYIPRDITVSSKTELATILTDWLSDSSAKTIGDVGTFGRKPWIRLNLDGIKLVLNSDTKRHAVMEYVDHAGRVGVESPWTMIANRNGTVNKGAYSTDTDLFGWYCYASRPWPTPGTL